MNKPLIVASVVCAFAFAANADFGSWFTGIGVGATTANNLSASSGTWTLDTTHGDFEVSNNVLDFDLDDGYAVAYNVDASAAPDADTVTKVTVSGVFTAVKEADLPDQETMNTREAQVGFVICDTGNGNSYYAWVGGARWMPLSNAGVTPDPAGTTTLIVEFDYSHRDGSANNYVKFSIDVNGTEYLLDDGTNEPTSRFIMTSTKGAALRQVAGISCYGSGSLAVANGDVELGVASVGSIKYGSLADAAGAATSGSTIDVLRATSESVTLPSGITLKDANGLATGTLTADGDVTVAVKDSEINGGVSGTYALQLRTSGSGTFTAALDGYADQNKEVASTTKVDNTLEVKVQTKASILAAANPGGDKALSASVAKLREFIAADEALAAVDAAADVTTASITTALQADGSNGLPKWESYVLGIAPNVSAAVVPAPAGDTDTGEITLAIPAISASNYSGDYNVSYKVADGAAQSDPGVIKVPLATGTSEISIELTPAQ